MATIELTERERDVLRLMLIQWLNEYATPPLFAEEYAILDKVGVRPCHTHALRSPRPQDPETHPLKALRALDAECD